MATITWDENIPSGTSAIKLGDDDIRSFKSNLRGGLASEHSWPSTTGAQDRGLHLPDSSRVSYGATPPKHSDLDSGKSGFMYLDTGAEGILFAYPSASSEPVGGDRVIHADEERTHNQYFVQSAFKVKSASSNSYGANAITYAAAPKVTATVESSSALFPVLTNVAAHEVKVTAYTHAGAADSSASIHVLALGLAEYTEGP